MITEDKQEIGGGFHLKLRVIRVMKGLEQGLILESKLPKVGEGGEDELGDYTIKGNV